MFTFEIVATAWLAASTAVLVPALLVHAVERTAKSFGTWMHGAEAALPSQVGPLSH